MDSTPWGENEIPKRVRQQKLVADLGRSALETGDITQVVADTATAAAEALDADCAMVFELVPDDGAVLRHGSGWADDRVDVVVSTSPDTHVGYTLHAEEPVLVDDFRTEDRFSGPELRTGHDVSSGISVSIGPADEPWGVLGVYSTDHHRFDAHDAYVVQSIANVLAAAIEAVQTQPELETMHDRISDAFYSLNDEWEFTYLNERAEELIDVADEGLVGKNVWETFEWAADSKIREEYERAIETQEATSFELYYPEPLERWYEIRAYPSETGLSVYFRDVTERVTRESAHDEAMQDVRKSEERLRLALEAGEMGTWELDLQTEDSPIRSPQHDRIFGYEEPREDWNFATFLDHVHPDDREDVKQRFEDAFETGTWEFECRIIRVDGEERVISARGVFYFDDEDEPVRAVGIVRDITDQKVRERKLEEAKTQLEAATEAGAIGTWEWRIPENEMVVGTSFARTFGVDPEAARDGVPLEEFVASLHEDDRDRVVAAVESAVESCGEYEEEYRVWNADDELRWVIARGHVECDEDGNAETFPGALVDITERKATEEALRESETKFRMVAENLDEVVWITTEDAAEFLYINPSFDEIWGVDRQTLYDDPDSYTQWVHPDDRDRVRTSFAKLPNTPFDEEYRIRRPDGERRWLRVRGEQVENDEGMERVVGVGQDITERVERARKLEASNRRLEQFAYAASHDLQEPLRMVASYLQLLDRRYRDDLDEDAREFIDFAVDGAERMREMIDGLLEYSRVESEGKPFEPVDLATVVEDVRTDLQLQIEESDGEITTDSLPRVRGDGGQLRQVFQNLLTNAIEYCDDDPPRVHISAAREGSMWRISVRDEGIGIDPDDADRVFEVFERLHTREEHEGTGIGLAICKRIVERHGGEIWAESSQGEGTTFSLTLPAAEG